MMRPNIYDVYSLFLDAVVSQVNDYARYDASCIAAAVRLRSVFAIARSGAGRYGESVDGINRFCCQGAEHCDTFTSCSAVFTGRLVGPEAEVVVVVVGRASLRA